MGAVPPPRLCSLDLSAFHRDEWQLAEHLNCVRARVDCCHTEHVRASKHEWGRSIAMGRARGAVERNAVNRESESEEREEERERERKRERERAEVAAAPAAAAVDIAATVSATVAVETMACGLRSADTESGLHLLA